MLFGPGDSRKGIPKRERASPVPGSLRRSLMAEPTRPSACSHNRERRLGCQLSDRTEQVVLRDTRSDREGADRSAESAFCASRPAFGQRLG